MSMPFPVTRNCRPDTTPSSLSLAILAVPCAVRTLNEYGFGSFITPQSISWPVPEVSSRTASGLILCSSDRFFFRWIVVVPNGLEAVTVIVLPLILADRPEGKADVSELFASIPFLSVRLPI